MLARRVAQDFLNTLIVAAWKRLDEIEKASKRAKRTVRIRTALHIDKAQYFLFAVSMMFFQNYGHVGRHGTNVSRLSAVHAELNRMFRICRTPGKRRYPGFLQLGDKFLELFFLESHHFLPARTWREFPAIKALYPGGEDDMLGVVITWAEHRTSMERFKLFKTAGRRGVVSPSKKTITKGLDDLVAAKLTEMNTALAQAPSNAAKLAVHHSKTQELVDEIIDYYRRNANGLVDANSEPGKTVLGKLMEIRGKIPTSFTSLPP
jgi:hypothetical protein